MQTYVRELGMLSSLLLPDSRVPVPVRCPNRHEDYEKVAMPDLTICLGPTELSSNPRSISDPEVLKLKHQDAKSTMPTAFIVA